MFSGCSPPVQREARVSVLSISIPAGRGPSSSFGKPVKPCLVKLVAKVKRSREDTFAFLVQTTKVTLWKPKWTVSGIWQRRLDTFSAHMTMRCAWMKIIAGLTCLTSPALFPSQPSQYGLGQRENVNCQREVKLQLGSLKGRSTLKMLQVGKASSWSTGSVASPPSCTANPSRGRTA